MLQLQSFTYNAFQENTYVLFNEQKQCWITDPGMMDPSETAHFLRFIEEHKWVPQGIINTHAHIDHILGVDAVAGAYHIPFYLHEAERMILENAGNTARMFGFPFEGVVTKPDYLSAERTLQLGTDIIEIRFVPGHSPGSIALYSAPGNWLIAGDTLFAGSIGRTDLPGGDYDTLISSIRSQILTLPGETSVYPGHGPATTVAREQEHNPFLQ